MYTTNSGANSAVQAVIFDMDGVLVDSEPIWDEVRRGLALDYRRPWPADATRIMQGMSTREWSAYLVSVVGVPGAPESIATDVIDLMAARYARSLPLLPGAVAAVTRIAAHWPLGLASSSPRRLIDSVLASAGMASAFTVTVSTEEVAAGKPAPDVYLAVAAELGVSAGRTVAVEDSTNGLRSAASAGLRVIAVPQPTFPPAPEALSLADAVVAGLSAITVELIESLGRPV